MVLCLDGYYNYDSARVSIRVSDPYIRFVYSESTTHYVCLFIAGSTPAAALIRMGVPRNGSELRSLTWVYRSSCICSGGFYVVAPWCEPRWLVLSASVLWTYGGGLLRVTLTKG